MKISAVLHLSLVPFSTLRHSCIQKYPFHPGDTVCMSQGDEFICPTANASTNLRCDTGRCPLQGLPMAPIMEQLPTGSSCFELEDQLLTLLTWNFRIQNMQYMIHDPQFTIFDPKIFSSTLREGFKKKAKKKGKKRVKEKLLKRT